VTGYLGFFRRNARFLLFGILLAGFSGFGQTFFIALSGGWIVREFGLSNGEFGLLFSAATLASAAAFVWLGRVIDRMDLRWFTLLVCMGLAAGCAGMALAESVLVLGFGIFLLRLTGQGLMTHTAHTSMTRYFGAARGKAVSISSLGHPMSEALFPVVAVLLAGALGWRSTWWAAAAVLVVGVLPLALWLLRGHGDRHADLEARVGAADEVGADGRHWSRAEVLRDPRFYLLVPGVMAPAFVVNGVFVHHAHLIQVKGWSLEWLAACFVFFGIGKIVAGLVSGSLVDRYGACRVLPYLLPPLGLGMLVLTFGDGDGVLLAYLLLVGVTTGALRTVVGVLWAEVYGVAHIGAIRSLTAGLAVVASAIAPAVVGWLIDLRMSMDTIALMLAVYVALATVLLAVSPVRLRVAATGE